MSEDEASPAPRKVVHDLAEDATGFGLAELRTTRDMIVRPAALMAALDDVGDTGGGRYARPFRYYLTLNGLYLLVIAMVGGFGRAFAVAPEGIVETWAARAGKSVDAFTADADQWYALTIVPLVAFFLFWPLYFWFRRWSGSTPRIVSRQVWTFMGAWTLYALPFGFINILRPDWAGVTGFVAPILWLILLLRFGRARWWTSVLGLIGALLVLSLSLLAFQIPAALMAFGVAALGAVYGP